MAPTATKKPRHQLSINTTPSDSDLRPSFTYWIITRSILIFLSQKQRLATPRAMSIALQFFGAIGNLIPLITHWTDNQSSRTFTIHKPITLLVHEFAHPLINSGMYFNIDGNKPKKKITLPVSITDASSIPLAPILFNNH